MLLQPLVSGSVRRLCVEMAINGSVHGPICLEDVRQNINGEVKAI